MLTLTQKKAIASKNGISIDEVGSIYDSIKIIVDFKCNEDLARDVVKDILRNDRDFEFAMECRKKTQKVRQKEPILSDIYRYTGLTEQDVINAVSRIDYTKVSQSTRFRVLNTLIELRFKTRTCMVSDILAAVYRESLYETTDRDAELIKMYTDECSSKTTTPKSRIVFPISSNVFTDNGKFDEDVYASKLIKSFPKYSQTKLLNACELICGVLTIENVFKYCSDKNTHHPKISKYLRDDMCSTYMVYMLVKRKDGTSQINQLSFIDEISSKFDISKANAKTIIDSITLQMYVSYALMRKHLRETIANIRIVNQHVPFYVHRGTCNTHKYWRIRFWDSINASLLVFVNSRVIAEKLNLDKTPFDYNTREGSIAIANEVLRRKCIKFGGDQKMKTIDRIFVN